MKRILILFLSVFSIGLYAQNTNTQNTTQFDVIRNETAIGGNTKGRIANAYEALNASKQSVFPWSTTGTDNYAVTISGVTSISGEWFKIKFINANTGAATLNINSFGAIGLKKKVSGAWVDLAAGDINAGDICFANHDGTRFQIELTAGGGGGSSTYAGVSPTTVTVGGLNSGSAIAGNTYDAIIQAIVAPYVNPNFSSFSISGQSTTVEVGTTLSGSKTFTWGITLNSGAVALINLYDNTAVSTLLSNTANDGTQAQTITTIQLNTNGATQSWKGVLHDTNVIQDINSSNFIVTGRFYRFFGSSASSPTNSATVRALPSSTFHTGATTFTLATGNTLTKFVVALPPGVTISTVIDTDALNADITSQYFLTGTINVLDAGSTNRLYNIYEMNIGVAYTTSHNHSITTAN